MPQPIYVLLSAAIALLICGCQGIDLRGPAQITGLRPPPPTQPTTTPPTPPCDILEANEFMDVIISGQSGCPKHIIGMQLKPGMVLHLATPTWGPRLNEDVVHGDGYVDVQPSLAARQPQIAAPLRLPVRYLGTHGQLTNEEILVLGAFLSLQRIAFFGTTDPGGTGGDNLSAKWQTMLLRPEARAALWNAFVNASSVRRIAPTSALSKINRALALVVNPKAFCDEALTPSGPYTNVKLTPDEGNLLKAGLFSPNCNTGNKNVEAFALSTDAARADPLAAIVIHEGALNPGFFESGPLTNPATVVSAELSAVSMRRIDGAEHRWSLAEWEESGACGGGRSVLALGFSGAILDYGVVGRGGTSFTSFRVREDLTATGVVRRIEPIPDVLHLSPAISAEDLDRLTPGDINYVVWSTAWPSNTPDPCEP